MKSFWRMVGCVAISALMLAGCGGGEDGEADASPEVPYTRTVYPSAAEYGITDETKSALVVIDQSPDYIVLSFTLKNRSTGTTIQRENLPNSSTTTVEISPGNYTLDCTYFDSSPLGDWVVFACRGTNTADFYVAPGDAAVYRMTGGENCKTIYLPPTLTRDSSTEEVWD